MHFRILGPLWVANGGVEITPTAPKVRQVLAFLLVRCGKLVQVGELIDELWGESPPNSAMTTLQTYIYKLRKDVLEHCGSAELHTRVSGYLLDVSADLGDLRRFDSLAQEGRAALDDGDAMLAADRLSEALALWRGPALADVAVGDILSAHVTRLEEERLRVLEQRITADLELGRHQQLVSELKMLVSEHPLNERFYAHLMVALNRSGRRYEALEVYQGLRRMLVDELGMEPSASVQRLHLTLLNSDTTAGNGAGAPLVPVSAPVSSDLLLVPAQLPPDIPDFVGREDVLERIHGGLLDSGGDGTAGRAVCISGMPAVGKTTLALRAGHANRAEFPDGQLYADLRGTSENPADPHQILEGFIRAIGVPAHEVPESLQERSKLFRTWSMGARLLVVLDDALSVSQIAPLLPASPGSSVIITTRWGLYSLPGVRHVELEEMTDDEAVELLESASGRPYHGSERRAAERAAELCGRLPIALRSLGSRMAAMRNWPIGKLVAQLDDPAGRLDVLAFADLDVRARCAAGYRRLDPQDRSMFRLISLLPPPDFTADTAARLVGAGTDLVEAQLIRLAGCHMLAVADASGGEIRYRMHELVRLFARECLDQEFLEPMRAQARSVAMPDERTLLDVRADEARAHGPEVVELDAGDHGHELEPVDRRVCRAIDPEHRQARPHHSNGLVRALEG
ncbi:MULTISPECIES: AfsR/SARP family transcriptional regulator [Actinomadura]|uniref:BTAD domain-containing putative transcriptional regulator n=1 Tax=Actinomadura yumaensis TaxID=111807 RepID=A0ABW2CPW0_9ACTN|nr:AfsR/SARP family transcriptional regulator [Actinomadura sp. J1-007]